LDDHGVTLGNRAVTARKVEGLSAAGLLFEPDISDDQKVAHVRALGELDYGPHRSADETALRMLAMGHCTGRARSVLAAKHPPVDLLTSLGRVLPPEVIDALRAGSDGAAVIAQPVRRIFAALGDVPEGGRETYNGELIRETPDARASTFFGDVAQMMTRSSVADPELIYDVAYSDSGPWGPDKHRYRRNALPYEVETVEQVAAQLGTACARYSEIVATAPMDTLVSAAVTARQMLPGPGFDARSADVMAAFMAPLLLGAVQAGWAPDPSWSASPPTPSLGGNT